MYDMPVTNRCSTALCTLPVTPGMILVISVVPVAPRCAHYKETLMTYSNLIDIAIKHAEANGADLHTTHILTHMPYAELHAYLVEAGVL